MKTTTLETIKEAAFAYWTNREATTEYTEAADKAWGARLNELTGEDAGAYAPLNFEELLAETLNELENILNEATGVDGDDLIEKLNIVANIPNFELLEDEIERLDQIHRDALQATIREGALV